VIEMHESHAAALPRLCREAGLASAEARRDLAGLPRYVVARAPGG
jgi:release factor glutamine methyltransferase